jgi:hypothetical protein
MLKLPSPDLYTYSPGLGFTGTEAPAREVLADLHLPEGVEPSFKESASSSYMQQHPLLGAVTVSVFKGRAGSEELEWHMASVTEGRVWIDRVALATATPNSYGVLAPTLLAGVYNTKPIEYDDEHQLAGLTYGKDYQRIEGNDDYVDVTPLLDNLPIIQRYREVTGLERGENMAEVRAAA